MQASGDATTGSGTEARPASERASTPGAMPTTSTPSPSAMETGTRAASVPAADADPRAPAARAVDADAAPASTDSKDAQATTDAEAAARAVARAGTVAHAEVVERPTRGSIEVEMRGFKNARGQVLVALWRTGRGFPDHAGRAFGKARTNVRQGRARVVFEDVPPGAFAVVVHHDENRDFRMDTGLLGIPAEGYGFSRDASGSFGPPSFDDARLWLAAGKQRRVRIHMRY